MGELQTALFMARWSNLTYEDAIEARAKDVGISYVRVIKPEDEDIPVLALVGMVNNWLVVSFRGTVAAGYGEDIEKWKHMILGMICNIGGAFVEDEELYNTACELYGGKSHLGFIALLDEIWPDLLDEVLKHVRGKELYLTGHSLGGALATLAAHRFQKSNTSVQGVYTFGSPRVCDDIFCSNYLTPHYRFENKNDIVPHLPPSAEHREIINDILDDFFDGEIRLSNVNYQHVGRTYYINESNQIEEESYFLNWKRNIKIFIGIDRIASDHSMINYIRSLEFIISKDTSHQLFTVRIASIQDLEKVLLQGDNQFKIMAVNEICRRGFCTQWILGFLFNVIMKNNEAHKVLNIEEDQNLREACLVALGSIGGIQYSHLAIQQLDRMISFISQIIINDGESERVRMGALWALLLFNRYGEPVISSIFERTANSANVQLKTFAKDILENKVRPPFLPGNWSWLAPYRFASAQQLVSWLDNPGQLNILNIIEEIGFRGYGIAQTYAKFNNLISWDVSNLSLKDSLFPNIVRRNALWTLGILNRCQNWGTDTKFLPGISKIKQVIENKYEVEMVKLAAVESLWILDRSTDAVIRSVLRIACRDHYDSVKETAKKAISGRICPSPFPSSQNAVI